MAHHLLAKRPVLVEDVHQSQRDGGGRHEEVGYGEVGDEDVPGGEQDLVTRHLRTVTMNLVPTLLVQKAARREKLVRVPMMMIRL